MFELVSNDLRLVLEVPERHAASVAEGTKVSRAEGAPLDLVITRVAPSLAAERRSRVVEADLPSGVDLLAGAFVPVRVELGVIANAVRVPKAAIFQTLGRDRVVRVVEGRTEVRDIEWLGDDEERAVVEGVGHGDFVVTRGAASLPSGVEVRIGQGDGPEDAP